MTVHFILSGETLESISEEIKLENPSYLKEFHNRHCAREDYIDEELIPHKKLLIPDINTIREYNSRNDAPFKAPELNPDIPFEPENFSRIYNVFSEETYETALGKKQNALSYTVSVKWVRREPDSHIFHLFKNNFSEERESMLGELASESIRSLNPLEVKTDLKGNILKVGLTPHTTDNFEKIMERLADLFPDPYAKIYLEEFKMAVLDQEIFNTKMKQDVFIKNYFAALRNPFQNGKSYLRQSIGEEDTEVMLRQKVANTQNDDKIILVQTLTEEIDDLGFSGKYTLSADSGWVENIEIRYVISQYGVKNTSCFKAEKLS